MSDDTKDGGPAFPCDLPHEKFMYDNRTFTGMSLRDYVACKAMSLFPVFTPLRLRRDGLIDDEEAATLASNCYAIADAMLKARQP